MGMPLVEAGKVHLRPDGAGLRRENVPTMENMDNRNSRRQVCATGSPAVIALAHPRADKCWHQLLPWLVNRLREKPLEVSHGARLLLWTFWRIN